MEFLRNFQRQNIRQELDQKKIDFQNFTSKCMLVLYVI